MFKKLRITVLLYVLVLVGVGAWLTSVRSTDWSDPLWVLIYPINGDGSAVSAEYMAGLTREDFAPVEAFFAREARRYGVRLERPFAVNLAGSVSEPPPVPPASPNALTVMAWSLRLRWWAWQVERAQTEPPAHVQVFVLFHDPEPNPVLPHSLGLEQGLIGVVHAFASHNMAHSNNVVIAHELMHTVGASDKYEPRTGQPQFPDGYADPGRSPRFPQARAELMGGRIPLDEVRATTPRSLTDVVVGPKTAVEVNWVPDGS